MPGKKLDFPSRAKRKALLEELKARLSDPEASKNEFLRDYMNAMVELDKRMEELSAEDEKTGIPKNLSAEDAQDLCRLMLSAGAHAENYLVCNLKNGKVAPGVPQMVDKLQGLMAKDYEALAEYDPAKPQSLPELQEGTRTLTIDLRDRKLGAMGNMQNSRIPMTVVNSEGKKRRGVFTKATRMTAKADYEALIAKAKAACTTEAQKAELDKFLSGYRARCISKKQRTYAGNRINEHTTDTCLLGHLCFELHSLYDGNPDVKLNKDGTLKVSHTKDFLRTCGVDPELLPSAAIAVMRKGLSKYKDNIGLDINAERLEIEEGARIDNRNTAMSAVAALLGCSDLVCRSDNMRFIDEDGKVTEGTFMDYAKGVDLIKNDKLFNHVAQNAFKVKDNRCKVNRELADIQVLDYLCNNVDRHQGNLMYDIDEDGQLRGVQCIDNDSSFGQTAKSSESLRVVSRSMKEKLEKMTPEMLKFALRGRGLSQSELQAAQFRLLQLKADIGMGVKVIDDEDFGKYRPEDLRSQTAYEKNLFDKIHYHFTDFANLCRGDTPFTPMPKQPEPDLKEVSATSRKYTVGGLTDSLAQVSRKVENKETGFKVDDLRNKYRGSSGFYDDMVTAAKEANELYKKLTGQLPDPEKEGRLPDLSKLVSEDPETLGKVIAAFTKVSDATEAYLNYKTRQRRAADADSIRPKNDYEKSHIDYAKDLKKITGEFLSSRRPANEAEMEDLQANTVRREREKRRETEQLTAPQAPESPEGPVIQ